MLEFRHERNKKHPSLSSYSLPRKKKSPLLHASYLPSNLTKRITNTIPLFFRSRPVGLAMPLYISGNPLGPSEPSPLHQLSPHPTSFTPLFLNSGYRHHFVSGATAEGIDIYAFGTGEVRTISIALTRSEANLWRAQLAFDDDGPPLRSLRVSDIRVRALRCSLSKPSLVAGLQARTGRR